MTRASGSWPPSAVMAAGTVFSRASRLPPRRAARRGARRRPARRPLHDRQHAAQHGLHPARGRHLQRRAGAAAGPSDQGRPGRRRRLRQPGHHPVRAVPRRGHRAARGLARRWLLRLYLERPLPRARPRRAPRVDRRPHPVVPAAGLLLRDVRPGRAGAQRPRPLRPDDVGADRQQPHRRRDARRLPPGLGRRRPEREQVGPLDTGQELLLGLGSTLGIVAQCLVLLPYLRATGLHLPPALRLPRPRARQDAVASACGPCCSSIVNQVAYLVVVKLASGGTRRGGDGTGYTVYCQQPADHDGAALDHHRLARDRDPAAALVVRPRGPARRPRQHRRLDPAHRAGAGAAVRRPAADPRRRRGRRRSSRGPTGTPRPPSPRPSRSSVRRWSSSPSTTSCCAASTPSRRPGWSSSSSCAVSPTNIAVAIALVPSRPPEDTAPMLVVAYLSSYAVGAAVSFAAAAPHGRRAPDPAAGALPRPDGDRAGRRRRRRLAGRVVARGPRASGPGPCPSLAARRRSPASAGGVVLLVGARLLRIREVTTLVDTVAARLRRG